MYRASAVGSKCGHCLRSKTPLRVPIQPHSTSTQPIVCQASMAKVVAALGGVSVASGGAALGLAQYDPEYRRVIEQNVPGINYAFDAVLGPPPPGDDKKSKESMESLPSLLPKKKAAPDTTTLNLSQPPKISEKKVDPEEERRKREEEEARRKDDEVRASISKIEADKSRLNKALEGNVQQMIEAAQTQMATAVEGKKALVAAIDHYCKLLRNAIDEAHDPQWKFVEDAMKAKEYAAKKEQELEASAKKVLEDLRNVIRQGREVKATRDNTILVNAQETLRRMEYQLEDAASKVKEAAMETKIVTEFKDLVEKGREQFARELKSILPNVDPAEKGAQLSENELNALIAHAHLKIDQLRKQLSEQQVREEGNINKARLKQKEEDNIAAEEKLDRELRLRASGSDAEWERKLLQEKEKFEDELRAQVRRAAAAHSEHLEQVLRAQTEKLEAEKLQAIADNIQAEREKFHDEIAMAMARLQGIEAALNARKDKDLEDRRSKELWLACQNLLESVVHGRKSGTDLEARRKPIGTEIVAIKEVSSNDAFVNTIVNSVSDDALFKGVYTEDDLKNRFWKVRRICRRTAMVGDDGGTLWTYFISLLQGLISMDVSGRKYDRKEKVNADELDTYSILSRARYFIFEEEDFASAIKYMNLLEGEPRRVAQDWIRDTIQYLETRQAAQSLLNHAAALSLRHLE